MSKILYGFLFLSLLNSCSSPQALVKRYKPSMVSIGLTYMPKPSSFDSAATANYVSGGFMQGIQTSEGGTNPEDDLINLGQLSFSRGHRYKNINYAYGADVFAGSYQNKSVENDDPNYFKSKSVQGYELKSSVNVFQTYRTFDLRLLGIDLAYSKEYGDYAKFRQQTPTTENVFVIPATGLFSAAINTEVIFRAPLGRMIRYGFRLSLKQTFGALNYNGIFNQYNNNKSVSGTTGSIAGYFEMKKYFFIVEAGDGGRLNIGYKF